LAKNSLRPQSSQSSLRAAPAGEDGLGLLQDGEVLFEHLSGLQRAIDLYPLGNGIPFSRAIEQIKRVLIKDV